MKQLLQSINRVNRALGEGDRHFESHIFFDGGVKDMVPSEFVLQLVGLLESTLGSYIWLHMTLVCIIVGNSLEIVEMATNKILSRKYSATGFCV